MITAWKLDLNRVLQVFTVRSSVLSWSSLIVPLQTELVVNTHTMVLDLHRSAAAADQEGSDDRHHESVSATHYPSATDPQLP